MCFSDKPIISIPNEFGIRLEDCLYVGDDGPHFSQNKAFQLNSRLVESEITIGERKFPIYGVVYTDLIVESNDGST